MKKDSSVIDFGGLVIEDVRTSTDTNGKTIKVVERREHGPGPFGHLSPVFPLFFILMLGAIIVFGFLAKYYLKTKAEIAKLMIQNNMQPNVFAPSEAQTKPTVSPYMRYGILLIAIGLAFLLVYILELAGVYKLKVPVLLLFMGSALLFIQSKVNKQQNK